MTMKKDEELREIIANSIIQFRVLEEDDWNTKPAPEKWSKKEHLGHLADSAYCNHRRFVISQYEQNDHIVYHQDEWVDFGHYQEMDIQEVIQLWKTLNIQLAWVIQNIPEDKLNNTCNVGKEGDDIQTLSFLIEDYIRHMNHHLNRIINT